MKLPLIGSSLGLAGLGLIVSSGMLTAQSVWHAQEDQSTLRLEMMRPTFDDDNFTTFSSAWFATGRMQLTPRSALLVEVPFGYGELSAIEGTSFNPEAQTTFGNIYVGYEQRLGDAPLFFEFGARAPLVDEDQFLACLVGITSDLNRQESFGSDMVPVNALVSYRARFDDGVLLFLRGGPNVWIPIDDRNDAEVIGLAEAQLGYAIDRFGILAGVASRTLLSEDLGFDDRTNFQFGAGVWYEFGQLVPALQVRVPIDEEMRDVLDTVIGFSISVRLN
ncbi:MAG: hypothetical protein ABFS14_10350 [Gemmatimonadota bacterium]